MKEDDKFAIFVDQPYGLSLRENSGATSIIIVALYFGIWGVLGLLALFRPAVALAGILCFYALKQWALGSNAFFLSHATLTNFLAAILVVVALAVKFLKKQPILSGYPLVGWLVLALFGYTLFSLLWTLAPYEAVASWQLVWPYILVIIVLTPLLMSDFSDLNWGFQATLALGTIISLLILATTTRHGRSIVFEVGHTTTRLGGASGNPLAIAAMAGYIAIIGVLMNFRGLTRFWQLVRWGIVIVGVIISIQSGSRGQFFAMLIAILTFLPLSRRIRNVSGFIATAIGILIFAGVVAWAYSTFATSQRWDVTRMVHVYHGTRLDTAKTVLEAWFKSSPTRWLVGLGTSASFAPQVLGFYPHFVPVEVLAEEGVIGFTLFCAILALSARSALRVHRRALDFPVERGLTATLGALILFEFILCCKEGSLIGTPYLFAFAIILGRIERISAQHLSTRSMMLSHGDGESVGWERAQYAQQEG